MEMPKHNCFQPEFLWGDELRLGSRGYVAGMMTDGKYTIPNFFGRRRVDLFYKKLMAKMALKSTPDRWWRHAWTAKGVLLSSKLW